MTIGCHYNFLKILSTHRDTVIEQLKVLMGNCKNENDEIVLRSPLTIVPDVVKRKCVKQNINAAKSDQLMKITQMNSNQSVRSTITKVLLGMYSPRCVQCIYVL